MPLVGANQWLSAAAHRRSIYGLKGTSVITDERVTEIIRVVQSFSPSAYNSQPLRFTLVTKAKHKQMWDVILQAAEPVLRNAGSSVWDTMKAAMEGHKAAYGTVSYKFFFPSDTAAPDPTFLLSSVSCEFSQLTLNR